MKGFRSVCETIGHHGKIALKGLVRMVYGAGTAGLIALAVYGFIMIPTEEGWVAVCEFIGSTATLVVALTCMYAIGAGRKRGAYR